MTPRVDLESTTLFFRALARVIKGRQATASIYSAQDEIRPEVMRFAHAMEEKLRRNDYKGGWKDCQPDYLIKRLCEEYLELRDAIREKGLWGPWVRGEAADVANFAMMVWDIAMIAEENQVRDSWKPIIAENEVRE